MRKTKTTYNNRKATVMFNISKKKKKGGGKIIHLGEEAVCHLCSYKIECQILLFAEHYFCSH